MDQNSQERYVYYRRRYHDHIVANGRPICNQRAKVPGPDDSRLKPISEVTPREWQLITSGVTKFCGDCARIAESRGLIPEDIPDKHPSFMCPECGDTAEEVFTYAGTGYVEHEDSSRHSFDMEEYERWRRGMDVEV